MNKGIPALALAGVVVVIVLAFSSGYRVNEWEQAIITQFGRPVGDTVNEAGLHWRVPFVQEVHRFEKRLLEYDGDATEIPTRDKKFIFIDTFARWRIVDPLLFYQSVRDVRIAKTRLDDIVDSETRDIISGNLLIEAVRNTNRELLQDVEVSDAPLSMRPDTEGSDQPDEESQKRDADEPRGQAQPSGATETLVIEKGREVLNREILSSAKEKVKKFGIELIDVQIKSINYVTRVQERVYERMISERDQIADKYRAEGNEIYTEVLGKIQREKDRILSEAYREAETLKGEAEAEAARIYAEAYGRDPEFYAFWKSLQIYRESVGNNVSLVVGSDNDLFRYLSNSAGPQAGAAD